MSHFSNQLQNSMAAAEFTQQYVVDKIEVSQGQMSRYVNGENRPEPEVLAKMVALFPINERAALLIAYLEDDLPPRFRDLVDILPRSGRVGRIREEPAVYRAKMPEKLREAYDYLGEQAITEPKIAHALVSFYRMLKTKAA